MQPVDTLLDMLGTCRPMNSRSDWEFRKCYLESLPGATEDAGWNIHVTLPRKDGTPSRVLWSSHTDTVHQHEGYQRLQIDGRYIKLAKGETSNCLGADDTVGVWLMREMILAGVPGHYVFHYGEERGGIGSREITQTAPELFVQAQFAIAFDRHGTKDIITHQACDQCCSEAFAVSLARQLKKGGLKKYRPSSHGIFTDTANYTDIVNECTNISVGYENEHFSAERTDWRHALKLLAAMLKFDETQLVCKRQPGDSDYTAFTDWDDWRKRWGIESSTYGGNTVIDSGPIMWDSLPARRTYIKVDALSRDEQDELAFHLGVDPEHLCDDDLEMCSGEVLWELGIDPSLRH